MKKTTAKLLGMILSLALLIGTIPPIEVIAKSKETVQILEHFEYDAKDTSAPKATLFSYSLRETGETSNNAPSLSEVKASYQCTNTSDAADYLKQQMLNRSNHIVIAFPEVAYTYADGNLANTYYTALAHTGVGNEGDYLWTCINKSNVTSYIYTDYVAFVFDFDWRTTKVQEDELSSVITEIENSIEKGNYGTDEDIIIPVYQYLMTNMTYDTESYEKHQNGLDDAVSDLSYTAYAAATKKTAVCAGFAALIYRILLDKGIDCRLLNSDIHCWNAVKCEGKWYECDVTSDLQDSTRNMNHLLKSSRSMRNMNNSVYAWNSDIMRDYDEIKAYNWADDNYYSLVNMTIRGFKSTVTHKKDNKSDKQTIKLVDANGKTLKEGKDYEITYEKTNFGSRTMKITGLGKYSGSSFDKDYKVKLEAPKIKKIERCFNKDKTKVRFKVTFDKSYGANYYILQVDGRAFKFAMDTRKTKANYIYTGWFEIANFRLIVNEDIGFHVDACYVDWSKQKPEYEFISLDGYSASSVKILPKGKKSKTFK